MKQQLKCIWYMKQLSDILYLKKKKYSKNALDLPAHAERVTTHEFIYIYINKTIMK